MAATTTFKHIPTRPVSLTAEYVREHYQALTDRIASAEASGDSAGWLVLFADWNALKSYVGSEGSRIHYAQSKDMADPKWDAADTYYREQVTPAADNGNSAVVNALLASRHKDAIATRYGRHLIRTLETSVEPLAPINSDLRVKESDLVNQYDKLVATGEIAVNGKTVTLAVARSLQSSEDAATRRAAFEGYRSWFLQHREAIAGIYHQLVALRDQMGRNLGHANFIPLGYLGMGRTDYGPAEAATFRAGVRQYAVPLQKALNERQAAAYATPTLAPWDVEYDPALSLPSGIVPVGSQLDKAQRIFDGLSPKLGGHFSQMRRDGLIDLENRKGKRAGAFCTSFSDEGKVAIFCNSTGDPDDVSTLMHEMGHAFQASESQVIETVDQQWPTSDAAEVHSMGMEYLSMRHMGEFFTQAQADRFRSLRWKHGVELICYISIVDEFQHWVYENPTAAIDERDAAWRRIWDVYKPGIDFSGVEDYKHARWYAQGHLFWSPFYYIDYAVAETGAMQLALVDAADHDRAMEAYLTLCQIGGTKSVLEIFGAAGLRSPFDPDLMRDLMTHAAKELGVASVVDA
ncbi:MAG: M3 family oligoendopeptidase [Candidatus Sericytochromatia bacterium]|nr:M3 family oligoendopeptidase [Candidatus Sericytochromatia bacterium]